VRRLGFGAAVLMLATIGAAQVAAQNMPSQPRGNPADAPQGMAEPEQGVESKRIGFGRLCGIADTASLSAIALTRSAKGEWSVVRAGTHPEPGANAAARVWREANWMVDLHDTPGPVMHTGQMCFAAGGQLILQTDDYMDRFNCACIRFTAQRFDESGKVKIYKQWFVNVETGAEIAAPEAAGKFPEVFGFRRVEQLPFYPLVKK
jgi:hypothetical protein